MADSEADRIIREANQIEKNFRATRRTEDFLPVAAELLVNGRMADTLILVFIRSIQLLASRGNKHSQSSSG